MPGGGSVRMDASCTAAARQKTWSCCGASLSWGEARFFVSRAGFAFASQTPRQTFNGAASVQPWPWSDKLEVRGGSCPTALHCSGYTPTPPQQQHQAPHPLHRHPTTVDFQRAAQTTPFIRPCAAMAISTSVNRMFRPRCACPHANTGSGNCSLGSADSKHRLGEPLRSVLASSQSPRTLATALSAPSGYAISLVHALHALHARYTLTTRTTQTRQPW